VVTTTGRGYASPPGLRKSQDIHLDLSPETPIWLYARKLPFGLKPEGLAQPLPGSKAPVAMLLKPPQGPEGRYNLDLVGRQNPANLGCVSPPGLAIHRDLQPVVTTTGKGCSSPPGLRKAKDIHLALARRFPFGYKPGDTHLAISPKTSIWIEARRAGTTSAGVEGPGDNAPQTATGPADRYNLDLVGRQNPANLGCVSPPGLAIHRDLQPVVTTTGRGYASPSGLRKFKDFHLAICPKTSIWF
jgi:hypothetical protein